jgi:hypothetical protein
VKVYKTQVPAVCVDALCCVFGMFTQVVSKIIRNFSKGLLGNVSDYREAGFDQIAGRSRLQVGDLSLARAAPTRSNASG